MSTNYSFIYSTTGGEPYDKVHKTIIGRYGSSLTKRRFGNAKGADARDQRRLFEGVRR